MDTVSLEDVKGTEGGVEYWSGITVSMDVSTQPKAKAKAKAKSEAGGASGVKAIGTLEKTLKGYLAQEMLIKNQTEKLQNYQKGDPHNWAWADNLFNECAAKEAHLATCKGTEFMHKFGAAALSPESLKKVKKRWATNTITTSSEVWMPLRYPLKSGSRSSGKSRRWLMQLATSTRMEIRVIRVGEERDVRSRRHRGGPKASSGAKRSVS